MRVIVCGGRHYSNEAHVRSVLTELHKSRSISRIITGGATGADALAAFWAGAWGVDYHSYPAEWSMYGRAAGPKRNQQMLDKETPDLVVAFPGGSGTDDMVARATKAGVPVMKAESGTTTSIGGGPASGRSEPSSPNQGADGNG